MRTLLALALGISFSSAAFADLQVVEYPTAVTRCAGSHAQIGVRALSDGTVHYEWSKEIAPMVWSRIQEAWYSPGMPPPPTVYIELETNRSVLSIPVTALHAGKYRVDIVEFRPGEEVGIALLGAPFFITPLTADVGVQGGVPGSDGLTDSNDFIVYIDAFFSETEWADIGRQGGLSGGDGLFNNNDLIAFIDLFFSGCTAAP